MSVNVTVRDGRIVSATPSFIGADPARLPLLGGELLRPLGRTEDLARELVRSLDPGQREQSILHPRAISDIVSGNRPRVRPGDQMMHMQDLFRGRLEDPRLAALVDRVDEIAETGSEYDAGDHAQLALTSEPRGLLASDMTAEQRELLRGLIATYTDRGPRVVAEVQRRIYADDEALSGIGFGWAGATEPGEGHYFRLAGPRLLAEYDNTQRGANHAHSVWRDPLGDFGLGAT